MTGSGGEVSGAARIVMVNDAVDEAAHWSRVAREGLARRDGAIPTLRAEGDSLREIAHAAGLSHAAVRKIILRG